MHSCVKSSLTSQLIIHPPKKDALAKNQTVSKSIASVMARENIARLLVNVSNVSIIVTLEDVHKYSQVGQSRTTHAKMEEQKDVLLEKRDNREWDVSANRENWDKQDQMFKIEVRDWHDSKSSQAMQIQAKNNR